MEAGLGGGPRQQRGHGGNHAGRACVALVTHQHVDVAALGNVVTVQGLQAADDHQPAAGHGGAGVASQPHGIQVAIGEDAVTRGAQEAGQTVLHRQRGRLVEEGRVACRVEGQRVGRRRQVAVGPGWLRRPEGGGIKGSSRSQGSGHRVISCKQGRHGLPIEITRSAGRRLDNRQLAGRMFHSFLTPLQVSLPPLGEGCRPSHEAEVQAPQGLEAGRQASLSGSRTVPSERHPERGAEEARLAIVGVVQVGPVFPVQGVRDGQREAVGLGEVPAGVQIQQRLALFGHVYAAAG